MADNLYQMDVTGPFVALCGGNGNGTGSEEDCLEVAMLADGSGYAIRDVKPEGNGRELRAPRAS
ncbi:DUF397 domain-containing protein [Streptacidiphilus sp. 4-A2]|nr:DUF397 domain-containing protein [Streptacidiphilus sp. 4-A2]